VDTPTPDDAPAEVWIALLVEAATLLGADSVRVYFDRRGAIVVRILGAALERDELLSLPSAAGELAQPDEAKLDEARREALERVATVLSLLCKRGVHSLVLDSYASTPSSLRWGEGGTVELAAARSGSSGSGMVLEAEFSRWQLDRSFAAERELLQARCCFARLDIQIDGVPIVRDLCEPLRAPASRWLPRPAPLQIDGELLGYCGFEPDRRVSGMALLSHGVLVETVELAAEDDPEHDVGFLAMVDSSKLRRDLSLQKIVRDQVFEQILAAVGAARRSWLDTHAYAVQSRKAALAPASSAEATQIEPHIQIAAASSGVVWLGFWLWLANETEVFIFWPIAFAGLALVPLLIAAKIHKASQRKRAAKAGEEPANR
jgi:hypothetical protein